jgi:toxin CptA
MHSAPAVSYPVGRSRDADRLLLGLWALGATCAGGAVFHLDDTLGGRAALLVLSVLCAGAAALWLGRSALSGELHFDGRDWSLGGAPSSSPSFAAARAEMGLDLQFLMLLRLVEPGRPRRWLWLERRGNPSRWQDLRRAVYSRAPTASPAVGAPPSPLP